MSVAASGTHRHPPTTLDSRGPHTRHKLNHDREGSARRIRGDRAVRRRLRRSIGESGGGGWGAAEGRGRGRRQVEPWRGVVGSNGFGGRSRRRHRRAASASKAGVVAWVAASSLPSPPSLPSSMTSSAPLASASASASGARRRLETGPAPTNEQAEQNEVYPGWACARVVVDVRCGARGAWKGGCTPPTRRR